MTVLYTRRYATRRLTSLAVAFLAAVTGACSGDISSPAAPDLTSASQFATSLRPSSFTADINMHTGQVTIAAPTGSLGGNPSLSLADGGTRLNLSLLGGDAVQLIPSNYRVSAVGAFTPGKVRVTFDVVIENKLIGIKFITPTWPTPPAAGVILFPLEQVVTTAPGGVTGGNGNEVIVELPSHGMVVPSIDWNGTGSAGSGAPFNFFNDADCAAAAANDCFRWEAYDTQVLPAPATSSVRMIGFDIDPTVSQFRVRMIVAADVVPVGTVQAP